MANTQPEVAVDQARRALATFEWLGASLDADRVAASLALARRQARVGAKGVGLLTAGSGRCCAFWGRDCRTPRSRSRLYISRKTASHHVSSVLAKLVLRNRAEAAAYAAERLRADSGHRVGQLPDARGSNAARSMRPCTTEVFRVLPDPIAVAEIYESAFVPAFFAQWAPILCEAAGVAPGQPGARRRPAGPGSSRVPPPTWSRRLAGPSAWT